MASDSSGPALAAEVAPGPDGWHSVVRAAIRHQVAPLLLHRLEAAGLAAQLPAPLAAELGRVRTRVVRTSLARQRSFIVAARALRKAGIPAVPFKGIALAFSVYPEPALRPMADVDLWVPRARAEDAARALRALGLRDDERPGRPLAWQLERDGEIRFTRAEDGHRLIELHVGFFAGEWLHHAASIDRQGVEARLVPGTILGEPVHLLSPEDTLLHLALHASVNEQLAGPVVRQCLDLALVAGAGRPDRPNTGSPATPRPDWAVVVARAREWRVCRAVGLSFTVADILFPGTPLGGAAHELLGGSGFGPGTRFVPSVDELLGGRSLRETPVARLVYLMRLVDGGAPLARLRAASAGLRRVGQSARIAPR